jgi:hypothetical protein
MLESLTFYFFWVMQAAESPKTNWLPMQLRGVQPIYVSTAYQ